MSGTGGPGLSRKGRACESARKGEAAGCVQRTRTGPTSLGCRVPLRERSDMWLKGGQGPCFGLSGYGWIVSG